MSPTATLSRPATPPKPQPFVLGPALNGIRMTADEFDSVTEFDEDFHYELIDGVLIVNAIPDADQRDMNGELGYLLKRHQRLHLLGGMIYSTWEGEFVRSANSRRRADRVIWAGLGRKPNVKDMPTIVVEFVSAGRKNLQRDDIEKRDEYLAAGVKEYWVFDRFQRTITVFRQTAAGIVEEIIRENDTYRPALLPGFELRLMDLLICAEE